MKECLIFVVLLIFAQIPDLIALISGSAQSSEVRGCHEQETHVPLLAQNHAKLF